MKISRVFRGLFAAPAYYKIHSMYTLIRKCLFCLPAETAHHVALSCLKVIPAQCFSSIETKPIELMGLRFKNRIGVAAGLDKNGDYIDALGKLGFGFIEVGTVTPKPQAGNPRPRLFRLPEKQALLNRMGFNNKGMDYLIERLKTKRYSGVIGVNIGKNASTPMEKAADDYVEGLTKIYPYADYITINISSPNTPGLRTLQQGDFLDNLLKMLSKTREHLVSIHGQYKPLLLKISPDENIDTLKVIAEKIMYYAFDGIIATNTSIDKTAVSGLKHGDEAGGLSGEPILERSNNTLARLKSLLNNKVVLVGAGGISTIDAVQSKLTLGAQLIQVYTGLIYQGPFWIRQLLRTIE